MTPQRTVWNALLALIAATATTACAFTPPPHSVADADRAEGSSSDVITSVELRRLDPGLPALEAIEQARPGFPHGAGAV